MLDVQNWDLCVDAAGNWAVATEPYALLQDASTEGRLWLGEYWYDTTIGIPYRTIFGVTPPPIDALRAALVAAAEGVPDVQAAQVFFSALGPSRQLTGQLQVEPPSGQIMGAPIVFNVPPAGAAGA